MDQEKPAQNSSLGNKANILAGGFNLSRYAVLWLIGQQQSRATPGLSWEWFSWQPGAVISPAAAVKSALYL